MPHPNIFLHLHVLKEQNYNNNHAKPPSIINHALKVSVLRIWIYQDMVMLRVTGFGHVIYINTV